MFTAMVALSLLAVYLAARAHMANKQLVCIYKALTRGQPKVV